MINKNGFLQAALEFAELGYSVFPCVPNGKQPFGKLAPSGCKDATTNEDQICEWWEAYPSANIGLSTAGLVVVDIDGEQNEWLKDKKIRQSLSTGAASKTPRGGRHYIFRQPESGEFRNTASKIAPNVDTRADGGYILAPPSVVDGKPYQWLETYELQEKVNDLATLPDWIVDLLAQNNNTPLELPEDGTIKKGTQHTTLFKIGCNMRRWGASFDEINAALQVANTKRCEQPGTPKAIEDIARDAAKYEPEQREQADVEGWVDEYVTSKKDPGPFPEELFDVPGFIAHVKKYMGNTAYKRQPVLDLAAAITLMGTLTGRKITDHYGTRTNVYCLGVCKSGGGKDNARKVNKNILAECAAEDYLGPEGLASHAGLVSAIEKRPCLLFQLDEIGRLMKTLGNPGSSPHLFNIVTVLMKLFSSADTTYIGDAYADAKKNVVIKEPHVCLYGTTVPQSLYEGFTGESVSDGFLSRMMIFESDNHDPKQQERKSYPVPDSIKALVRSWMEFSPGGNLSSQNPQPYVVEYETLAVDIFNDLEELAYNERQRNSDTISSLWTRATEKARKLALIYACSANVRNPVVDLRAAQWACRLSEYLTRKLIFIAEDWISETPFDNKKKKVLRIIKEEGSNGITRTKLYQRTRSLKKREREEVLDDLKECKEIRINKVGSTTVYHSACTSVSIMNG